MDDYGCVSLTPRLMKYIEVLQSKENIPSDLHHELEVLLSPKFNLTDSKCNKISFNTVRKIHQYLHKSDEGREVYLHELLEDADVHLPEIALPQRSAELETRIQRLRQEQENKQYNKMTSNLGSTKLFKQIKQPVTIGEEIKSMNSQIIGVANFLLTVFGGFMFGYKVVEYNSETPNLAMQLCSGLICGTIVFFADLYFLVKAYL